MAGTGCIRFWLFCANWSTVDDMEVDIETELADGVRCIPCNSPFSLSRLTERQAQEQEGAPEPEEPEDAEEKKDAKEDKDKDDDEEDEDEVEEEDAIPEDGANAADESLRSSS